MSILKYIKLSVIALIVAITFFACEGNDKKIDLLNISPKIPLAEGRGINLKYTDSGRVVSNLISPLLLDYSNFEFPFTEFPKGVKVHFWNKENEKSTVTSNYAIHYNQTNLVDLRGDVVLFTSDSTVLNAQQMYWDVKNKWLFTDLPYRIKFKDGSFNDANSFDSSEDFKNFLSRKNIGVQLISEKDSITTPTQ